MGTYFNSSITSNNSDNYQHRSLIFGSLPSGIEGDFNSYWIIDKDDRYITLQNFNTEQYLSINGSDLELSDTPTKFYVDVISTQKQVEIDSKVIFKLAKTENKNFYLKMQAEEGHFDDEEDDQISEELGEMVSGPETGSYVVMGPEDKKNMLDALRIEFLDYNEIRELIFLKTLHAHLQIILEEFLTVKLKRNSRDE